MKILTTPNPILTQPAQPVSKIDKKILEIVKEMKKTLLATQNPKGVGLAAPQVGIPLRIFITKPFPNSEISIFINPQIIWKSEELTEEIPKKEKKLEGCLSLPGVWGIVKRHHIIKLKYQDLNGKIWTKKFSGFMATIIQHEIDHLNGKLFSYRVLEQKGKFYKIIKNKEGKEELEEICLNQL